MPERLCEITVNLGYNQTRIRRVRVQDFLRSENEERRWYARRWPNRWILRVPSESMAVGRADPSSMEQVGQHESEHGHADGRSRLDGERRAASQYRRTAGLCRRVPSTMEQPFARCTYLYVRILVYVLSCTRAPIFALLPTTGHVVTSKISFFFLGDPHICPRVRWTHVVRPW
jgi:hypothetical protein